MRVLVTGVAGFIGFHTARRLVANGHCVVGLDNLNDYYDPALKHARLRELGDSISFVKMDVSDAGALADLVAREVPDVIVHLAAQVGVRYSVENPFAYAQSNLMGHLAVLEACRHSDSVTHLVYASSSSVYGRNRDIPFTEDQPVEQPSSFYGATKRCNEVMSVSYAHLYGIRQVGLRFFTVYGEWGRPDMAIWAFTRNIIEGKPIQVFNNGDMMRDFTYVDDIVTGVVAAAEKAPHFADGETPHRLYNIGNNAPVSLMTFIETIEDKLGMKAEKIMKPMQPGDVHKTFADVARIGADYGFRPSTDLDEGIARFVAWYRDYHGV